MKEIKNIALVAHDGRKQDMIEWVEHNKLILSKHKLYGTGTTGSMIKKAGLNITCFKSGPLGGDLQLGNMIVEGTLDLMFFFWDPMSAQPHDVDVKALLRIATLQNIPVACNRSSADFMISSPLFNQDYEPVKKDYSAYLNRLNT